MVTQLQDVANTVAQEKISNQRLRNEEIRRQMANPWSEPVEPTTSGTQPLQDVTKGTPTLASTYSGLLNNYHSLTGTSGNSGRTEENSFDRSYSGNPNPFGISSWGPGAFFDAGTAVHLTRLKVHGRYWSSDNVFAKSRQSVIFNGTTRSTISQYQLEFGCAGIDSGLIQVLGGATVAAHLGTVGAAAHGAYLFDFATSEERGRFELGSIQASSLNFTRMAGLVRLAGDTAKAGLFSIGTAPSGMDASGWGNTQFPPVLAGGFRSTLAKFLSDDTATTFKSHYDRGFVFVTSNSSTANGIYWYRTGTIPNLQPVYAGTSVANTTGALTGTTGTDGKLTISASTAGLFYVENRTGSGLSVSLTFIGT